MRRAWLAFLLLVVSGSPLVAAYEFTGSAFVQDDGTIRIRNRTVHLWGILIPDTREDCVTNAAHLAVGHARSWRWKGRSRDLSAA